MKYENIWHDKGLLVRQVIAAWAILFFSVVFFVILALMLSLFTSDQEVVILTSLALVIPILIGAHISLYKRNYHLSRSLTKPSRSRGLPKNSNSNRDMESVIYRDEYREQSSISIPLILFMVVIVVLSTSIDPNFSLIVFFLFMALIANLLGRSAKRAPEVLYMPVYLEGQNEGAGCGLVLLAIVVVLLVLFFFGPL